MSWLEIKEHLTEPIFSKKKDPILFFPLVFLVTWLGTVVYQRTGISYVEYILWLIPIALVLSALYILLIAWLKKKRAKRNDRS